MQATDQSSDAFHQKASTQYLQGKFEEALATWKQILANDPEDPRATEGVRLCELLTQEGAGETGAAAPEAQPETGEAPVVPEEAVEFEVADLEIDLPETQLPDPLRQSDGIDLGAEPEVLEVDGEIPPIVEGVLDGGAAPKSAEPGAEELQKRVQDLMAEARAAYDGGDTDTARSVLGRVFILDETNAEALQYQEKIEDGVPAATQQVDVKDLDAPDHDAAPGEFDLAAEAPEDIADIDPAATEAPAEGLQLEALETAPEPAVDDALAAETFGDPPDDDFPDFDTDSDFEDTDAEIEEAVEPARGKIKLPQRSATGSKTRWIVVGVVVGIVLVVGVGFWMRLRSVQTIEAPVPIAQPTEVGAGAAPEPVVQAQAAPVEPAPVPTAAPTEDVATLLARGNTAFEAGEYSLAIIAFNALLQQDPNHFDAIQRMEEVTVAYRNEQEIKEQWIAAASLFRDGEFRSAMQMFYRLHAENEEDRVRIARFQENGWYNMGLLALRSARCDTARQHFDEASQIDPEDADIALALALCDSCESGTGRGGFQRAVASMKMRRLDD